jgi:hypothetical protein
MSRVRAFADFTSDRATHRYALGLKHKAGPRRADGRTAVQVENYRSYQQHVFPIELRVKQLFAASRFPRVHLFAYLSFARAIDRLCRREQGRTRDGLCLVELQKAEARGLARELLLKVCREVFEIDPERYNPRDRDGVSAEVSRPTDGVGPAPESGPDQSGTARD